VNHRMFERKLRLSGHVSWSVFFVLDFVWISWLASVESKQAPPMKWDYPLNLSISLSGGRETN
jgi:hypothetical protein